MINIANLLRLKSDSNAQNSFKEEILIKLLLIAICFFLVYSLNNYVLGNRSGFYFMLGGAIIQSLFLYLFVKRKLGYFVAVNAGIGLTFFCLILDTCNTGGIFSPTLPWIMLVPMLSFLLLEKSQVTVIWLIISIVSLGVFGFFGLMGFLFPYTLRGSALAIDMVTSYVGLAAMLVIITVLFEQKKNKIFRDLVASEKRFRAIFEKSPLGIGLTNSLTGVIDELNPKYAEIVGRDASNILNVDWMSMTHPEDLAEDLENMQKMNDGLINGFKVTKRYIRPDSTVVWVDVSITPIDVDDRSNPRHLCMIENITERIAAEKIVKAKEQNLLLLRHASQVPGVIYQFQYFSDSTFTFPFVSEGVFALFSLKAQAVMENPYLLLGRVHRNDINGLLTSFNHSLQHMENWAFDCRVNVQDKGVRWFRANSKPEAMEDGSIICHGYIADITEQKRAEETEVLRNRELLRQQMALLDLTKLPSNLEFNAKLKAILEMTAESMHCERVSIWVLDEYSIKSEYIYQLSTDSYLSGGQLFESDCPQYFSEIRKNRNIVANNTATHSATVEFQDYFTKSNITALLDIPIRKGETIIGVLCHEHVGSERKWTASEQAFTRSVSDIIALTFESEELKKTEDKLHLSEERWKFAIEGSNDGIWDWNVRTSVIFRSPKWAEMLGFDYSEIPNRIEQWLDRIHPDDLVWVNEKLQKHLRNETDSYFSEHRIICKNGEYKWFLHRGKVIIRDENGLPLRMVGTMTDITDRKVGEEELRQNEAKLKAIFTGSNDAIMLLTGEGFFDCNPKTLKMFGIESKELFTQIHPSDISPELQPDGQNSFDKANEMIRIAFEKGSNRFEWLHKKLTGEPFPAEVLLSAFDYGEERVLQATVLDISERKKSADRLEKQKEFYENILNKIPAEIVVYDANHKYMFVNPSAIKVPEYREFVIGKDDFQYYEYRNKDLNIAITLRERFEEVKSKGKVKEWENTFIDAQGQEITFLRGMIPIYNQANTMTQVLEYGFDISERKAVEFSLKQSEERLRLVLAGTNDGWWDWDLLENKLFFSKRWWNMFGYEENEIELTPALYPNIVHPEDKELVETSFERALSDGTSSYEIECRLLNKKGEYTPILSRGLILRNSDNIPIRVSGSDMDLTERKRADAQLKQSEEQYRSLIENSPEIILIADQNENILFINFASERYEKEEVIGKSLYQFVDEKHHAMIRQAHENIFKGANSESYETEGKNTDGTKSWFLTHVGPKYLDDRVTGLVLFIRNITDRKNAEDFIRQSLTEKEVLLKEVHHRVKNNLQIISSILNLQSSTIEDRQTLDLLRNSQDRIRSMSLIHELLYRTKDFSTIDFSEYIRSIATNLFQSYTENKKIELILELEDVFLDLDAAIPCGLIINELITNSLKYGFEADKGGTIKIMLQTLDKQISLKIEDNGIGFPDHIDFRDTESLGMQLVVSLIEQIDAEITLENRGGAKYEIQFVNNLGTT
jgi:PAS domain S-box-containing protein